MRLSREIMVTNMTDGVTRVKHKVYFIMAGFKGHWALEGAVSITTAMPLNSNYCGFVNEAN